ncbi:MAG: hypothetical protein IH604_17135 [Burkholderiales bacterium]|nr:hypothetical protein [Burkholderiales bacterium]
MKQFNIRLRSWSGIWLTVFALLAGAVFLWVGLALAMALTIIAGLALLPSWIRRLWKHKHAARGALTIEGEYSRIER